MVRARGKKQVAQIARGLVPRETRSFEVSHVGALWHLDFHVGSRRVLLPSGERVEVRLFGVIDDYSRLGCHLQWYLGPGEPTEALVHGLSQAFQKRGLPRAALMDNGSAMTSEETTEGLGRLSIVHHTILADSPEQNAKQENFWAQVEGRLMAMLEGEKELTLELLNRATLAWLEARVQPQVALGDRHDAAGAFPRRPERDAAVPVIGRSAASFPTAGAAHAASQRRNAHGRRSALRDPLALPNAAPPGGPLGELGPVERGPVRPANGRGAGDALADRQAEERGRQAAGPRRGARHGAGAGAERGRAALARVDEHVRGDRPAAGVRAALDQAPGGRRAMKNLLSPFGLKFHPFRPEVPVEALHPTPSVDAFCGRVEITVGDGGFVMVTGEPGSGKSVALRLLARRLGALRDVVVGTIDHPQSRVSDFYGPVRFSA